jgi:hypothetical protein
MTGIISISNGFGPWINVGYSGKDGDVIIRDSFIYGDGPIPDCLPGNDCYKIARTGIMTPVIVGEGKSVHMIKPSKLPQQITKKHGWDGYGTIRNVKFINWSKTTQ